MKQSLLTNHFLLFFQGGKKKQERALKILTYFFYGISARYFYFFFGTIFVDPSPYTINLLIAYDENTFSFSFFLAKQTSNIRERGRAMQRLIVKTNMRALTAKLRRAPFPGVKKDRVHSLRSVGAPALIGFSRRPVLCAKTRAFLESLNHVVPPSRSGWGNECIPAYSFPVNQSQAQHSGVR